MPSTLTVDLVSGAAPAVLTMVVKRHMAPIANALPADARRDVIAPHAWRRSADAAAPITSASFSIKFSPGSLGLAGARHRSSARKGGTAFVASAAEQIGGSRVGRAQPCAPHALQLGFLPSGAAAQCHLWERVVASHLTPAGSRWTSDTTTLSQAKFPRASEVA